MLVSLDGDTCMEAIREAVSNRITGGTIYDVLIAKAALACEASEIFAWNIRHFQLFGREVASRIKMPSEFRATRSE